MENDLISRSALKERWTIASPEPYNTDAVEVLDSIEEAPAVDAVSRPVVEQIQWERDCAMQQLKDHGIPFGGIAPDVVKVVRCCECIYRDGTPGQPNILCYQMHDDDFCSYGERRADDGK